MRFTLVELLVVMAIVLGAANAYLGIDAILPAIETEADVVITGQREREIRVAIAPERLRALASFISRW